MMVSAYPNDDDARSRRQIPSPLPSFYICAVGFILIEGASNLHLKLLDPRFRRIPTLFVRSSKCRTRCRLRAALKKSSGSYNQ